MRHHQYAEKNVFANRKYFFLYLNLIDSHYLLIFFSLKTCQEIENCFSHAEKFSLIIPKF